jgi:beta-glucanase (GH16 family)
VAALVAQLNATVVPSPPQGGHAPSHDNTYITAGGTLWDAAGHAWTIIAGVATRDSVADNSTSNVVGMLWWGAHVYNVNNAAVWHVLVSVGTWTATTDPRAVSAPGTPLFIDDFTSRNITTTGGVGGAIVVLAGSGGSITDGGGAVWTISPTNTVLRNGSAAAFTANVSEIAYATSVIWHANSNNPKDWYSWDGANWNPGADPTAGGSSGSWMDHYPFGGSEYTLSYNNEAQYYGSNVAGRTPGFDPFSVANSILAITANTAAATGANPLGLPYNSGAITSATETSGMPTHGMVSQKYGYFVMRALLPAGRGYFPAFWIDPDGRGGNPEIDIFEALGHDLTHIMQTIHYDATDSATYTILNPATCTTYSTRGLTITVSDYSVNWHTYGADVQADRITFYVDGIAQAWFPTPAALNTTFYMLANLAVGGAGSWPGPPDGSTALPGHMRIDYIAIYANRAAAG